MDYLGGIIRDRVMTSVLSVLVPLLFPSVKTTFSWILTVGIFLVIFEMFRSKGIKDTVLHILFTTLVITVVLHPSVVVLNTADILDRTQLLRPEVLQDMRAWGWSLARTPLGAGAGMEPVSAAAGDNRRFWFW